jgi:hypothetical protein
MSVLAILLLTMQTSIWTVSPPAVTVGDTVRITRRVSADPDARSAVLALATTAAYIPLSAPTVAYSEGAVVVRYQLAFFETGDHPVVMPDLELAYAGGRIDVVPGDTAWIHVISVLPAEDDPPLPRASLGPIARAQHSFSPAIFIATFIVVCLVAWALWRRRTSPRPLWNGSTQEAADAPLQQWIMAGESKAAVGVVADRLRDAIESGLPAAGRQLSTQECLRVIETNRPDWPRRDIEEVLRSLDRAQYAPAVPSDVALIVDQVDDLVSVIRAQPGEESGE